MKTSMYVKRSNKLKKFKPKPNPSKNLPNNVIRKNVRKFFKCPKFF